MPWASQNLGRPLPGEAYHLTHGEQEIAEVHAIRRRLRARDLVACRRGLPRVHIVQLRAEADKYFDAADRVGDDERDQGH